MDGDTVIPITLKWNKQVFSNQISISIGLTASQLKDSIRRLTGVPNERQKLMCKKGGLWKGILRDDVVFDNNLAFGKNTEYVVVTLIGSADSIPNRPEQTTKFVEDMTMEELAEATALRNQAAWKDAEGMIVPLQRIPEQRNDNKTEMYNYNRLVTGLPQKQIEDLLKERKQKEGSLLGKVVMTMGLELRRAYVNALIVLPNDGTLASGLDDGHIQLWRHGELERDIIHDGVGPGGVDSLVPFNHPQFAFASGGRGCIRIWTIDWECVQVFPCVPGTSPACLTSMFLGTPARDSAEIMSEEESARQNILCLVSSFRITRKSDPNQFRLVPQDEAGRRRRALAEAEEERIQATFNRVSRTAQLLFSTTRTGGAVALQSLALEPTPISEAAPITTLVTLLSNYHTNQTQVVCGDANGGLRVWQVQVYGRNNSPAANATQVNLFQLMPASSSSNTEIVSVACMEPLPNNLLAVSTEGIAVNDARAFLLPRATPIRVPSTRAVHILDTEKWVVTVVLDGHRDTVRCMAALPNGGIATGGGKMDATLQVWEQSTVQKACEKTESNDDRLSAAVKLASDSTKLDEVGYVLAIAVVPDSKAESKHFALAVARYNAVKICL